jgi:cell cycle sensor histidine kinase DivJ
MIVISWSGVALCGLVLSGGGMSPLTVLLAAGPVAALLSGARRMAAEAGVFAALALYGVLAAGAMGALPPAQSDLLAMAAPFAFAGLVLISLMIWMLVHQGPIVIPAPEPVRPAPGRAVAAAGMPVLPASGAALLDVTPQGRLRRVAGDRFGMTTLRPGTALTALFEPGSPEAEPGRPGARLTGEARLRTGQAVLVAAETRAEGMTMLLFAKPDLPADAPEQARAAFEAELKARTGFFASLGHDLKTPLNAILGYSEVMQAELMGPMPEPYADYPSIILESGNDLLLIVDDILDLARAEAGRVRLDPEPVDLTASAEAVIRQMSGQAKRAGVTLKLKSPGAVWAEADARAVRQIWQNLVSNAIKYSSSAGTVTLETRIEGGAALLSVTDRGAGIAPEDLERLAEPFTQAPGAKPGTGLGLSVVRRFAELHGGSLKLTSRPGRGTKAEVTLPKANASDLFSLDEAAE